MWIIWHFPFVFFKWQVFIPEHACVLVLSIDHEGVDEDLVEGENVVLNLRVNIVLVVQLRPELENFEVFLREVRWDTLVVRYVLVDLDRYTCLPVG